MTEKRIRQELLLLESKDYRNQRERVFDFLNLFKKTNVIEWSLEGEKVMVKRKGNIFEYRTLVFSAADEHIIKKLYCLYRKFILLELLEQKKEGLDYFEGEQLALF
ncbi:hypothetical protein GMB34_13750 [Turicibacter sanguinis]|nr:hypothetical protein [Turicibacter sanguinis]MTN85281.1 hypothetical protein [Turicibacter sanguinis]MTN88102.1 hypothetical protein [Turicibacter sanguinis]MTN90956.1 hypothetical protein [Turicibacter sanguinis]MTN93785.1 hypothetical protein [Turicibacter sanguinis]